MAVSRCRYRYFRRCGPFSPHRSDPLYVREHRRSDTSRALDHAASHGHSHGCPFGCPRGQLTSRQHQLSRPRPGGLKAQPWSDVVADPIRTPRERASRPPVPDVSQTTSSSLAPDMSQRPCSGDDFGSPPPAGEGLPQKKAPHRRAGLRKRIECAANGSHLGHASSVRVCLWKQRGPYALHYITPS